MLYVISQKNLLFQRNKFYQATQGSNETIEAYFIRLQELAQECGFGNKDEMVRDYLILFSSDFKARSVLFRVKDVPRATRKSARRAARPTTNHRNVTYTSGNRPPANKTNQRPWAW